jgi:signal transduction histidine kinase
MIGFAGAAVAVAMGVLAAFMDGATAVVLGNTWIAVVVIGVMAYINITGEYDRGYTAIVILVFLGGFPFLYLVGGPYRPAMVYFFMLGLALTSLMVQGPTYFILACLEVTAYTTCWALSLTGLIGTAEQRAQAEFTRWSILEGVALVSVEVVLSGSAFALARFFLVIRYQAVLQNRALEAMSRDKDKLLATVAHELNTPLAVISAIADETRASLRSQGKTATNDACARGVEVVGSEARRLGDMVGRLLDLSRLTEGHMPITLHQEDLGEVIEQVMPVCARMCQPNSDTLRLAPGDADPLVLCDAGRVRQVIVNLVANAARYTRNGSITIAMDQDDQFAIVTVTDTGDGMPEETLKLVNSGNTAVPSKTGLGLGLALSRTIIHRHGGVMTVTSEEGVGTSVRFTLPLGGDQ